MPRIRVKLMLPISGPYGTFYVDNAGNFVRWVYCREIDGKWYFELLQSFEEESING